MLKPSLDRVPAWKVVDEGEQILSSRWYQEEEKLEAVVLKRR